MRSFTKATLAGSMFVLAAASQAQVNHVFWSDGTIVDGNGNASKYNTDNTIKSSMFNNSVGNIRGFAAEDNKTNNTFTWSTHMSKDSKGNFADAFWVVFSDGPNPKGIAGELAAFYFDNTDKAKGPKLSIYGYNGVNGNNSFKDGNGKGGAPTKIATSLAGNTSWLKAISSNERDTSGNQVLRFTIDKNIVNNFKGGKDWEGGINFTDKLGLWFHPSTGSDMKYGSDGFLTKYDFKGQGWADLENVRAKKGAAPVPEPATMAALGLGALGLLRRKKKQVA
jgi:hypothetical protein